MSRFTFLKSYLSPFKPIIPKFYIGKLRYGVPIFYPRLWRKFTYNEAVDATNEWVEKKGGVVDIDEAIKKNEEFLRYKKTVPKKIGFDFVDLGWKTKWADHDYRFEWAPIWSFVFFKCQICILFITKEQDAYWETYLNYIYNTDKTKSWKERIKECREKFPNIWQRTEDGQTIDIDYYPSIIKSKYLN